VSRILSSFALAIALLAATSDVARAQSSSLTQAILALPGSPAGNLLRFDNARLFEGLVEATITNGAGAVDDFQEGDRITLRLLRRDGQATTGEGFSFPFEGTRSDFDRWARDNARSILEVLFAGGLSSGLMGRDTNLLYSQQLLLTTILSAEDDSARGRTGGAGGGGLFEFESLRRDQRGADDSLWALQGVYGFGQTLSIQGRLARNREHLKTTGTSLAVDYHPFIERFVNDLTVRLGGMARGGFVYSRSTSLTAVGNEDPLQFGSIDLTGGGWASVRRDFRRFVLSGGALVQGTNTYVPGGDDENSFRYAFAEAVNGRGIEYDVTFGGLAQYDLTIKTSIVGKFAETRSLKSAVDRSAAHMIVGGIVYTLAPGASLNAGYKVTDFSSSTAHGIYFQGNFGW
jgi:hypothetical protein